MPMDNINWNHKHDKDGQPHYVSSFDQLRKRRLERLQLVEISKRYYEELARSEGEYLEELDRVKSTSFTEGLIVGAVVVPLMYYIVNYII